MSAIDLRLGDCRDVLATLESESVDLVLTDPPYNVSGGKKDIDRRLWDSPKARRSSVIRQDFGEWDKFATVEDFKAFTQAWLTECYRILKPGATLYAFFPFDDISDLKNWGKEVGFKWLNAIAWRKLNPAPNFNNMSRYCHAIEAIGWFAKGKVSTFNGHGGLHNFIETPLCQGLERSEHPTQKPLAVIEPLIKVSSNPGDLICDPFGGSGTTAVAAMRLGRRAIVIERDPKYYRICEERLLRRAPEPEDISTLPLLAAIAEGGK